MPRAFWRNPLGLVSKFDSSFYAVSGSQLHMIAKSLVLSPIFYSCLGAAALYIVARLKDEQPFSILQALNVEVNQDAKPWKVTFDLFLSSVLGGMIADAIAQPSSPAQALLAGLGLSITLKLLPTRKKKSKPVVLGKKQNAPQILHHAPQILHHAPQVLHQGLSQVETVDQKLARLEYIDGILEKGRGMMERHRHTTKHHLRIGFVMMACILLIKYLPSAWGLPLTACAFSLCGYMAFIMIRSYPKNNLITEKNN
ncbi:MAG: hypothetical protein PW734_08305 [Verrucomicrobium sp.]|nr:hypothetical protein [Verrucomicrobium sp.]